MNPDFNLGRRYERTEILEFLRSLRDVKNVTVLRSTLASWELELSESLMPVLVITETHIVITD